MSAMQQMRDSGIFMEGPPQEAGVVRFTVMTDGVERRGAAIYAQTNDSEVHIRVGALDNGRFPNNGRLHDFVREHAHGTVRSPGNSSHAYKLRSQHLGQVIRIIRRGG